MERSAKLNFIMGSLDIEAIRKEAFLLSFDLYIDLCKDDTRKDHVELLTELFTVLFQPNVMDHIKKNRKLLETIKQKAYSLRLELLTCKEVKLFNFLDKSILPETTQKDASYDEDTDKLRQRIDAALGKLELIEEQAKQRKV